MQLGYTVRKQPNTEGEMFFWTTYPSTSQNYEKETVLK